MKYNHAASIRIDMLCIKTICKKLLINIRCVEHLSEVIMFTQVLLLYQWRIRKII